MDALRCNICTHLILGEVESRAIFSNVRRFRNESFVIWRCPDCLSLHSKEEVDLDKYYKDYPINNKPLSLPVRLHYRSRLRFFRKHGLKTTHKILDYGCGTGLLVKYLRKRGYDVAGYDRYVNEFADKRVLTTLYDVVISQDVIEHVEDPEELLSTFCDILKGGGIAFIGTPNASEIRLSDDYYSSELHQPYHRHVLSEQAMHLVCHRAGLKLESIHRRSHIDTLFPMVNSKFFKAYLERLDGCLDSAWEKPQIWAIVTSPKLLFYGFTGYFLRVPANMMCVLRH